MSGRGRSAALPPASHRRRSADGKAAPTSTLLVHVAEKGDRQVVYDFTKMPVAGKLQRSLAALFAERLGPVGPWRQLATSEEAFDLLRSFAGFLAALEEPPDDITEITPAVWRAWVLSRPANTLGSRQISKVAGFLRLDSRLPAETRKATLKPVGRAAPTETSYSSDEFEKITGHAARNFRAAWRRISDNREYLASWRAGELKAGTDACRIGEVLDHLARCGDVPFRFKGNGQRDVLPGVARLLGGVAPEFTWRRLYLSNMEMVSLAVLLVAKHGWNSTAVSELQIPEIVTEDGQQIIYRVELEKRRRRPPHRYETRNLIDWGQNSPGRLLTRALEATAAGRDLLSAWGQPTDRLLVSRHSMMRDGQVVLRLGYGHNEIHQWATATGCQVSLRRLRRTVVVRHQRIPAQHSRDTHDQVYVLRDPATHQQAAPVIAEGIAEAIEHARQVVRPRVDRAENTADQGLDAVTASCSDYQHSPFSAHGSGCRASFLLCLACSNAVVKPRHVPRLAYLHAVLEQLQTVLDNAIWDHDWREHYVRLNDLRDTAFTQTEWADALKRLSAADKSLVDDLLQRGFDA